MSHQEETEQQARSVAGINWATPPLESQLADVNLWPGTFISDYILYTVYIWYIYICIYIYIYIILHVYMYIISAVVSVFYSVLFEFIENRRIIRCYLTIHYYYINLTLYLNCAIII